LPDENRERCGEANNQATSPPAPGPYAIEQSAGTALSEHSRLTHDFLAHMLGVHRPGVSIAVNALTQDGAIESRRNHIVVRDVVGLKAKSCECHGSINDRLSTFSEKLIKRSAA
jgi:hypothetical protein